MVAISRISRFFCGNKQAPAKAEPDPVAAASAELCRLVDVWGDGFRQMLENALDVYDKSGNTDALNALANKLSHCCQLADVAGKALEAAAERTG